MSLHFSIQKRRILITKCVVFLFLSITLLIIDKSSNQPNIIRKYLAYAMVPVEQVIAFPQDLSHYFKELFVTKQTLLSENDKYKTENTLLKASAKQYIALELENIRLREMLNASYEINSNKLLIASVISADNSLTKKSISINKGEMNGVYLGQPILDDKGVVGQVIDVKPMTSTVLLINDFQNYTSVMLRKSGKRFLAKGNAVNLIIENVESTQEIQVGDEIVTSGLSGLYPRGYPVGVISEIIQPEGGDTYSLKVNYFAGLDYSQEVILIWINKDANLYQQVNDNQNTNAKVEVAKKTTEESGVIGNE